MRMTERAKHSNGTKKARKKWPTTAMFMAFLEPIKEHVDIFTRSNATSTHTDRTLCTLITCVKSAIYLILNRLWKKMHNTQRTAQTMMRTEKSESGERQKKKMERTQQLIHKSKLNLTISLSLTIKMLAFELASTILIQKNGFDRKIGCDREHESFSGLFNNMHFIVCAPVRTTLSSSPPGY